jgi:hypothetical protein
MIWNVGSMLTCGANENVQLIVNLIRTFESLQSDCESTMRGMQPEALLWLVIISVPVNAVYCTGACHATAFKYILMKQRQVKS